MRRIAPLAVGFLVLAAFAWTLLFLYNKSQARPIEAETTTPITVDIVKKTVATGSIVPRREIEIKPRVSGVVEKLFLEAGQPVTAGQEIARIKIIPNVVALNNAEAQVDAARISSENATKELARFKELAGKSLISDVELSRLALEDALRRQELAAATSNLQLVKSGAARGAGKVSNVVSSTVTGTMLEVPVKEGASVIEVNNFNPGTTIAFVADLSDLIFQGKVDESEVGKIKVGMPLDLKIGAVDERTFKGKLEYIAPKGQLIEGAIQFEIKASIEKVDSVFIRANYSANADIVLDRRTQVLAIDEGLLQFDKDGGAAFVEVEIAPGRFERREIKTGLSDGINIEVLEGLTLETRIKRPESSAPAEKPEPGGPRGPRRR